MKPQCFVVVLRSLPEALTCIPLRSGVHGDALKSRLLVPGCQGRMLAICSWLPEIEDGPEQHAPVLPEMLSTLLPSASAPVQGRGIEVYCCGGVEERERQDRAAA